MKNQHTKMPPFDESAQGSHKSESRTDVGNTRSRSTDELSSLVKQVKPGLKVYAKKESRMIESGKVVATVDHLDGPDCIKLTKDHSPDQKHRWIPLSWVAEVDENAVYLIETEKEFLAELSHSAPSHEQLDDHTEEQAV